MLYTHKWCGWYTNEVPITEGTYLCKVFCIFLFMCPIVIILCETKHQIQHSSTWRNEWNVFDVSTLGSWDLL